MKAFPLAPALLLLLPLLGGCHKNTLAGKWRGAAPGAQGASIVQTYTFTDDGKEVIDVTMSASKFSFAVSTAGTYKVDGANLTQTLTSMTMGGRVIPFPAAKVQPVTGAFTQDGDRLTLTSPQTKESVTLTRVKG